MAGNRCTGLFVTSLVSLGCMIPWIVGIIRVIEGTRIYCLPYFLWIVGIIRVIEGTRIYCLPYFLWHLIGLGIPMRLVAAGGVATSWCGMRRSMLGYIVTKLILMVLMLMVSNQEKTYWEKHDKGPKKWDMVVSCLQSEDICFSGDDAQFFGCRKQPNPCGLDNESTTMQPL
ncbi:hypothetical protein ACH5RR_003716 [Cinchona calisaya]|uniref:Uncharacterized protein n=1 Tax=Cinchona calisaya TaxID=153742 RepID=A0ABD3AVJ6_9GENT